MMDDRSVCVTHFAHTLLRAENWQGRSELTTVCDWWRAGGNGVLALVGFDGVGKTAIADRFVGHLLDESDADAQVRQVPMLPGPEGLFVFSFHDAPNSASFFDTLYDWLVVEFQVADRRRVTDAGIRMQAPVSLVIDGLGHAQRTLLLVLDGLERLQDDGAHSGGVGHLADGGLRAFLQWIVAGRLPGLAVLVTTHHELDGLDFGWGRGTAPRYTSVPVGELSDSACIALLRHRGVDGGDQVLHAIAQACGRHALSVDLVAAYLMHFPHDDPEAALNRPTIEELRRFAQPAREPRWPRVTEQTGRLQQVLELYQAALARSDAAALALLQRLCVLRMGMDVETLTRLCTDPDHDRPSGHAVMALSPTDVPTTLAHLAEMRLIMGGTRTPVRSMKSAPASVTNPPVAIYTAHPAVRDGVRQSLETAAARREHDAVRAGLRALLGDQAGKQPANPATLDVLEEIVYHTLRAGDVADAWEVYCNRIGGYWNLGWRLGAYERGERICRGFAAGHGAEIALGATAAGLPFRQLPEAWQAIFLNEWAMYLKHLGCLEAAACCFKAADASDYRHENWPSASTGRQNLAEVRLLSGRLAAGLHAGAEALRLAERADDIIERMASHALRGHARAQRGEIEAALADFQDALRWQHQAEGQTDLPLYSLRGVYHALLLSRLGRYTEAVRLTEANTEVLLRHGGPQDEDIPKCQLILADLARERGDFKVARDICRRVHAWALERDAKEILCWSALVLARLELDEAVAVAGPPHDRPAVQPFNDHAAACQHTLTDGLQLARFCGYGIYHIDLLLVQARLLQLMGDADAALAAAEAVLSDSSKPAANSGRPPLLAATDPECGYAWGEAEARQLRAEALLLQAAPYVGRAHFVPATFEQLPSSVRWRIAVARDELTLSLALRQRMHDPKTRQTADALTRLNRGALTP